VLHVICWCYCVHMQQWLTIAAALLLLTVLLLLLLQNW
jgi:hypothetical protein